MIADLYDPQAVKRLFDEMARTYGVVNTLCSFGFNWRWRHQCLRAISLAPGATAVDLMTGMGELCGDLSRFLGPSGRIAAFDISESMCNKARQAQGRCPICVVQADVLNHPFVPESADVVVCSFGLKTLSPQQQRMLADIVFRLLKPGGALSFVEISVPGTRWLRWPYMFYLNRIIPWIGAMLLGNPDNYRMLGIYTQAFGNCDRAAGFFRDAGMEVEKRSLFFGCATGFIGRRPIASHVPDRSST